MAEIKVRRVDEADFGDVLQLLRQLWPDRQIEAAQMKEIYSQCLLDTGLRFFVGEQDGRIICFASVAVRNSLWAQGKIAHIDELVVSQEGRSNGTGTMVILEIEKIMVAEGCVKLEVDTALDRDRAHEFYRRNGFFERAYIFSKSINKS